MELEGFSSKAGTMKDGEHFVEYFPTDGNDNKTLRLRTNAIGNMIIEMTEGGELPGADLGERLACPVHTEALEARLLKVMAIHHFNAVWLEDGNTDVDIEMVRRGFEVGKMKSGDLVWYHLENGTTTMVKRELSDQLPGSFKDPARLVVVSATGKELVIQAMDFKSLINLIETNAHFDLYQPHQNVFLPGIFSPADVTWH